MKTSTIVIIVAAVLGTAALIIGAAVAVIGAGSYLSTRHDRVEVYYTTDAGTTWFADDVNLIPPFDKNGKTAVRVFLYKCGGDGKPFAGYLGRYSPEAAAKLAELTRAASTDQAAITELRMNGLEYAALGSDKWFHHSSEKAEKIINNIRCPDGRIDDLEPVSPNK